MFLSKLYPNYFLQDSLVNQMTLSYLQTNSTRLFLEKMITHSRLQNFFPDFQFYLGSLALI
jgi:hypothetical protein